jgi:hypothetical protein
VIEDDPTFAVYDDNCGFPSFPGAAVDTEAIANLIARVAIHHLLGTIDQTNHWVWFNSQITHSNQDPQLQYGLQCQKQTFLPLDICGACQPSQISLRQADKRNQVGSIKFPELFSEIHILQEAYPSVLR